MNYDQLYKMDSPIKDLASLRETLRVLGNPQDTYQTIHVTGTNGKGSVCLKIAKALEHSGKRVGLYSSPHLVDYEERFQINGEMITPEEVFNLFERVKEAATRPLAFFEITTLIAFLYFAEQAVDIALIEVGIGGLLDSTNVITPILSIITSIGIDHADLLGDTLEEIAEQKAGIIKPGVPVILGPTAHLVQTVEKVHYIDANFETYDRENSAIASKALEVLNLDKASIEYGIAQQAAGRFEQRGGAIYDCAHNLSGMERLYERLTYTYPDRRYAFIVAFTHWKEPKEMLSFLEARGRVIRVATRNEYLTTSEKSMPVDEACELAKRDGYLPVICGSVYLIGESSSRVISLKPSKSC